MTNSCTQCKTQFEVTSREDSLYKKFNTQPSGLCSDCEHKHRLLFRNERVLYARKCDITKKAIVSNIAPESPYTVYSTEYWYSDKWDPMHFGKNYDFTKTFFEQYRDINKKVPRLPLVNMRPENSDYCNMCVDNKNCYLVFGGDYNQDCMYMTLSMQDRDCLDIDYTNDSELCYMMDNSLNCYGCQFVWDSKNCTNCYFSTDCTSCEECIFCSNLVNKSFCIENKQLNKEEYFKQKKEILSGSYDQQEKNWEKLKNIRENKITKYGHIISSENVTGDYIKNSKNCFQSLDISNSEDINNCIFADTAKDCYNSDLIGHKTELCHNSIAIITSNNISGCYFLDNCADIYYSEQCMSSHDLFGCNGLRNKQYCILNKQYSKEDYFELRDKIIKRMKKDGEWGKFFPKDFSPFAYNEGTCMRYFPLTKEQAIAEGFNWREEDPKSYQPQTTTLTNSIAEIPDQITREILACENCSKNYKIQSAELKFYKTQNIPIPHECHECRFRKRNALRTPFKLYDRNCAKCSEPISTSYAPDRPETVYCEKCYLKAIY